LGFIKVGKKDHPSDLGAFIYAIHSFRQNHGLKGVGIDKIFTDYLDSVAQIEHVGPYRPYEPIFD
jgi:hypothetical protein